MSNDDNIMRPPLSGSATVAHRFLEGKANTADLVSATLNPNKRTRDRVATDNSLNDGTTDTDSSVKKQKYSTTCVEATDVDWDSKLKKYFTMVVYGRRRIGKSVLASFIVSKIAHRFEEAHLFSKTAHLQPLMWAGFHKRHTHVGFSSSALSGIMDMKRQAMDTVKSEFHEKRDKEVGDNMTKADKRVYETLLDKHMKDTLILLDDIVGDPALRTSEVFQNIFTLGRHFRLTLIILSQNANRRGAINRECSGNVDYAFTSSMLLYDDLQTLAEQYWGTEGAKQGTQFIVANTAEAHRFLFADNTTQQRSRLADHCFTFRVPSDSVGVKYRVGKRVWKEEKDAKKKNGSSRSKNLPLPGNTVQQCDTREKTCGGIVRHYQMIYGNPKPPTLINQSVQHVADPYSSGY
mgnify:CR=1 FL=1